MNQSNTFTLRNQWRLRLSWKIVVVAYFGLAAASWGILSGSADLSTANGRHLLAGALANMSLVAMGIIVTLTAYRQGYRCIVCQFNSFVLRDSHDQLRLLLCGFLVKRCCSTGTWGICDGFWPCLAC